MGAVRSQCAMIDRSLVVLYIYIYRIWVGGWVGAFEQ